MRFRFCFLQNLTHFFIPFSMVHIKSAEDSALDAARSRSGFFDSSSICLQTKRYPNLPRTDFSTRWPFLRNSEASNEFLIILSIELLNFGVARRKMPVFFFSLCRCCYLQPINLSHKKVKSTLGFNLNYVKIFDLTCVNIF